MIMSTVNSSNDPVTQYALDVTNGDIVAGKYVRLACERHLNDLERAKTDEFPYYFDLEKMDRIIEFAEMLKFGDSEQYGQPVILAPFQKFILGSIFGWIHKHTGYRRFSKSYATLSRKNGKSILNAVISIYMTAFDNYPFAQTYFTATKKQQARILYKEVVKFLKADKKLGKFFKIKDYQSEVLCKHNDGTMIALSKDTDSIDGFNPHCGVVDEYHAHKDNQMLKLIEDGSIMQKQALISIITTAGLDPENSPCKKEEEYCMGVLDGVYENENYFIFICKMDKEDDIWNPDNWAKCSPLVTTSPEALEKLKVAATQAKEMGGEELDNFMIKSLNIWLDSRDEDSYMSLDKWKACGVKTEELPDLYGKDVYISLDLATKDDLTSCSFIIPTGNEEFTILSHSFMPEDNLRDRIVKHKISYDVYLREKDTYQASMGCLSKTSGDMTDYNFVKKYIKDMVEKYQWKVKFLLYDDWNASQLAIDLAAEGYPTVKVVQGMKTMAPSASEFKELVYRGKIIHDNNPLLRMAVNNAVCKMDENERYMVSKKRSRNKVDPIVSVLIGFTEARFHYQYYKGAQEHTDEYFKSIFGD